MNHKDAEKFIRIVILEHNAVPLREAGLKSAVLGNEFLHLVRISRRDAHELAPVVLQSVHKGLKRCLSVLVHSQLIGFVNEKYAAHCRIDYIGRNRLGVTQIPSHKIMFYHFHHLRARQGSHRMENFPHQPRHRGLARSRIAQEQIVPERNHRSAVLRLCQFDFVVDGMCQLGEGCFHTFEAD